jgi:sugar phosphate isomerase/epimerase
MNAKVGVCSWSLEPRGPEDLTEKVGKVGVRHVQLALDPIRAGGWGLAPTRRALDAAGIGVVSGMMAMKGEDYTTLQTIERTGGVLLDEHWQENLAAARANAAIAAELGLPMITFHAGILPHDRKDPRRKVVLDRVRAVAGCFEERGIAVALETGQETAATLMDALAELPTLGVNFDAANMILYGKGDPAEAVKTLAPKIVQFHVKDAIPTKTPGTWGTEVPQGTGAVGWPKFLALVRSLGLDRDFLIERESGHDRAGDIVNARILVEKALAR